MLDADKREALRQAKARIAEIMAPTREKNRQARKAQRKASAAARAFAPMADQRQPRVRDNAYLAFLRRQPCLKCGKGPSDAAHIRWAPPGSGWSYTGKAEKPSDFRCVPLCRADHELQHSMSESKFWQTVLCLDPVATTVEYYAKFIGQETDIPFDGEKREGAQRRATPNPSGLPQ